MKKVLQIVVAPQFFAAAASEHERAIGGHRHTNVVSLPTAKKVVDQIEGQHNVVEHDIQSGLIKDGDRQVEVDLKKSGCVQNLGPWVDLMYHNRVFMFLTRMHPRLLAAEKWDLITQLNKSIVKFNRLLNLTIDEDGG